MGRKQRRYVKSLLAKSATSFTGISIRLSDIVGGAAYKLRRRIVIEIGEKEVRCSFLPCPCHFSGLVDLKTRSCSEGRLQQRRLNVGTKQRWWGVQVSATVRYLKLRSCNVFQQLTTNCTPFGSVSKTEKR